MTATSPPHHVRATLGYYQPKADGSPPDRDDLAIILGAKDMDPREVVISDIRGSEDQYRLEEQGFQVVKHSSKLEDFSDEEKIKSTYYPEVEELLLASTGATKVIIFNHIVRTGPSTLIDDKAYLTGVSGPAPRVHIDQTAKGAEQMLFRMVGDDVARDMSSRRWQILNTWRPVKTIAKDPLAIADATTVPASHLVTVKRLYPGGKEGENCTVVAGAAPADEVGHKWYYLHGQQPDEVFVFKQHDSDPGARTRGTPHSSFPYPGAEDLENRQSIEVRAFVGY